MTFEIALILALLAAVVLVFSFEWVSVDVATLVLLCVLVLSGILSVGEAFSGFASDIVVILASIFVLSGALMKGGILEGLGDAIHRAAGGGRSRILFFLTSATALLSSFMNNTTTTAVMVPPALGLCKRSRVSPGKVLIPIAFASMLGGTCTLIGTSTNVAASGAMKSAGLAPLSMFELAPVGVAVVLTGLAYLVLVSQRLLPQTRTEELEEESIRAYLTEVVITEGSQLTAKPLRESRLTEMGLAVRAILRGDRRIEPDAGATLTVGDLLIVQAGREALLKVKETAGIEIKPDLHLGELAGPKTKIVEALLMPQSSLVGRSLKELDFRRRFGVTAIALYRRGHTLATKIGSLPLRAGDVLLLQGPPERFATLADSADLFILEEVDHQPDRRRKGAWALGMFAVAVAVSSLGWVELPVAFLLASLGVIATRLITIEEAYDLIDWRLLVLIAGMTAFGLAMKKTGTAEYLAGLVVQHFAPLGVTAVMLAFVVLTILLTQPMSNAAAALVVLPVAMTTATQMELAPRSFAVLVTLAASLSFITPFEPSCLIVYGPGKYRFRDYVVAGLPLTVFAVAVLMLLVPVFWPLKP